MKKSNTCACVESYRIGRAGKDSQAVWRLRHLRAPVGLRQGRLHVCGVPGV